MFFWSPFLVWRRTQLLDNFVREVESSLTNYIQLKPMKWQHKPYYCMFKNWNWSRSCCKLSILKSLFIINFQFNQVWNKWTFKNIWAFRWPSTRFSIPRRRNWIFNKRIKFCRIIKIQSSMPTWLYSCRKNIWPLLSEHFCKADLLATSSMFGQKIANN